MYSKLVLTLVLALTMNSLWAQNFSVRLVYPASDGRDCVYSIQIQNTAEDSIMVLHTQEAALPPFINNYKLEEASTKTGGKPLLLFGKSNNPFLPEQYLATKSLGPRETLELYFTLPVRLNEIEKWRERLDLSDEADMQSAIEEKVTLSLENLYRRHAGSFMGMQEIAKAS
jgi:hypothetical protein